MKTNYKDKAYVTKDYKTSGDQIKVYMKKSEVKYKEEDEAFYDFDLPDIDDVKKFIYYDEIQKKINTDLEYLKLGRDSFIKGLNAKLFKKVDNKKWIYDRMFEFWLKILEAKKSLLYEIWKKKKGPNGKKKSSNVPDHYEFYIPYYSSTYKPYYHEEHYQDDQDHYSDGSYGKQ